MSILRKFFLLLFFVFIVVITEHTLPSGSELYFLQFVLFSGLFFIALSEFGYLFRRKVLKSTYESADFALGLGLFAFFLNWYFKFTTSAALPLGLLLLAAGLSIFKFFKTRLQKKWLPSNLDLLDFSLLGCLTMILFWYSGGLGILQFPQDFDSGMLHLALPKRWMAINEIGPQIYYRCPFLGFFAHGIYYFLLEIFDGNDSFIKIINLSVFVSLFLTCRNLKLKHVDLSKWALVIPSLLVFYPDTREYLVSSNLDAMFMLLLVSGFFILMTSLETKQIPDLLLGTILVGFSAGLKHFGFMMSAPILGLFYLYFFFSEQSIKDVPWLRFVKISTLGLGLFLASSLAFYIHNLIAGNSILFPFIGSKVNTYGWTIKEIGDFGSIIEVWGHRKDVLGFFTLLNDISEFPNKYQLLATNTGLDFVYPSSFLLAFVSFLLAIFLFFKKHKMFLLIAAVNLIQLFLWYKGSQVVRYLLPNVVISFFVFLYVGSGFLQQFGPKRSPSLKLKPIFTWLLLFFAVTVFDKSRAKSIEIPITPKQKMEVVGNRYGDLHKAMNYLKTKERSGRIFYNGDASYMQYMGDLEVCGDWFGPCRFEDFFVIQANSKYLTVRPIIETRDFFKRNNIEWVVITWPLFFPHHKRPDSFNYAIPDLNCYVHEIQFSNIDIFKVNKQCLGGSP